jgi:hypothetical protein
MSHQASALLQRYLLDLYEAGEVVADLEFFAMMQRRHAHDGNAIAYDVDSRGDDHSNAGLGPHEPHARARCRRVGLLRRVQVVAAQEHMMTTVWKWHRPRAEIQTGKRAVRAHQL